MESEAETDTGVAEYCPMAGSECFNSADEPCDKKEVKIEIDVAEDPSLYWGMITEQHTHGSEATANSLKERAAVAINPTVDLSSGSSSDGPGKPTTPIRNKRKYTSAISSENGTTEKPTHSTKARKSTTVTSTPHRPPKPDEGGEVTALLQEMRKMREDTGEEMRKMRGVVREEMRKMREEMGKMRGEIRELNVEMETLARVKGEVGALRGEVKQFKEEMDTTLTHQLRNITNTVKNSRDDVRRAIKKRGVSSRSTSQRTHSHSSTSSGSYHTRVPSPGLAVVSLPSPSNTVRAPRPLTHCDPISEPDAPSISHIQVHSPVSLSSPSSTVTALRPLTHCDPISAPNTPSLPHLSSARHASLASSPSPSHTPSTSPKGTSHYNGFTEDDLRGFLLPAKPGLPETATKMVKALSLKVFTPEQLLRCSIKGKPTIKNNYLPKPALDERSRGMILRLTQEAFPGATYKTVYNAISNLQKVLRAKKEKENLKCWGGVGGDR